MKTKPKLKVTINGDIWKVYLLHDCEFERHFGDKTLATTVYDHPKNQRMMFFTDAHIQKSTVIHEVTHAFLSYQYIDSADLKPAQVEEIFCDFMANRIDQIKRVSNTIYEGIK